MRCSPWSFEPKSIIEIRPNPRKRRRSRVRKYCKTPSQRKLIVVRVADFRVGQNRSPSSHDPASLHDGCGVSTKE